MSLEYVVAGRRRLPHGPRPWTFELDGTEDELDDHAAELLDEGAFFLGEIVEAGNEDFFSWLTSVVGFKPRSVVSIDPAAWDMSRIAAEVLADSLDGVSFVDGLVDEHGLEYVSRQGVGADSLEELEARIVAAYHDPQPFLDRWAEVSAAAQAAREANDPEYRQAIRYANDWSDVSGDDS